MPEPKILLSGLGMPESPRWHEGRLWFCNWIDRQVVAVSLDGTAEVMLTRDPASHPMGYSIDWLPDGRLLTTGAKLERQERAWAAAGGPADELAGAAWEEPAGGGLTCPPQPAASQPASAAPVSRTSPRRAGAPPSGRHLRGVPGSGAAGFGDA